MSSRRPPRVMRTRPLSRSRTARRSSPCGICSRCCLARRSVSSAYPRTHRRPLRIRLPGVTARRAVIVAIAWRSEPMRAFSARRASWYWSSLVRVIDPAQREEDRPVSVFFRPARRLCAAGTSPIRARAARSAPASAPRCSPTARSTTTSAGERCSRVRMRHPEGGATTNGAASSRQGRGSRRFAPRPRLPIAVRPRSYDVTCVTRIERPRKSPARSPPPPPPAPVSPAVADAPRPPRRRCSSSRGGSGPRGGSTPCARRAARA